MKTSFPDYNNCLTNVTNSILKYYELETYHSSLKELDGILNEKEYKNIVLILYDGMGSKLLNRNLDENSFLCKHQVTEIDAVFPPTTTASTTSVLSGLNPNEHGWLGWDLYFEKYNKVVTMFLNKIKDTDESICEKSISEETYPYKNIIERINAKEDVTATGLFPFRDMLYKDLDDMMSKIKRTCDNNNRNFVYAYFEDPDLTQHITGTDSIETKDVYQRINKSTQELCESLKDTLVIIIADHGHINSEVITLTDFKDVYDLLERDISIEPRACSFKVKEGKKAEFEKIFNKYFSNYFELYTKEEVLEKQLFGPGINNENLDITVGDFLAVATSNKYFRFNEFGTVYKSMHAGITEDEVKVPLIIYRS